MKTGTFWIVSHDLTHSHSIISHVGYSLRHSRAKQSSPLFWQMDIIIEKQEKRIKTSDWEHLGPHTNPLASTLSSLLLRCTAIILWNIRVNSKINFKKISLSFLGQNQRFPQYRITFSTFFTVQFSCVPSFILPYTAQDCHYDYTSNKHLKSLP